MEHLRRLRKVINWLIFKEIAENERALAETLGYTKSSFSQIATGKVPLSEKFMKRICSLDENINFVWLQSGEGEMFLSNNLNSEISFYLSLITPVLYAFCFPFYLLYFPIQNVLYLM